MSSPEAKIIKHMNEDHELSLFAIVQSKLPRKEKNSTTGVKNCRMKAINLSNMTLSYVSCKGDMCEQKELCVKFEPPMASFEETRSRLVKMHDECVAPSFSWLFTEPLCRMILFAMGGLCYAHYSMDMADVASQSDIIASVFGEDGSVLSYVIKICWFFGAGAHIAEAAYAFFVCQTTLKMKPMNSFKWFIVISMVGYPMTSKILDFARVKESSEEKKQK